MSVAADRLAWIVLNLPPPGQYWPINSIQKMVIDRYGDNHTVSDKYARGILNIHPSIVAVKGCRDDKGRFSGTLGYKSKDKSDVTVPAISPLEATRIWITDFETWMQPVIFGCLVAVPFLAAYGLMIALMG